MTKIKTYIDSGVLISAYQGIDEVATKAIKILDEENRQFISSSFVKLEVLFYSYYRSTINLG